MDGVELESDGIWGHWEGTLRDLVEIVARHGGDMFTRILIESDGEPLTLTILSNEEV